MYLRRVIYRKIRLRTFPIPRQYDEYSLKMRCMIPMKICLLFKSTYIFLWLLKYAVIFVVPYFGMKRYYDQDLMEILKYEPMYQKKKIVSDGTLSRLGL